ncbi:serine hydrolase [Pseudoalteromonas viridis]|uniref:Serine hydrolase n=1 Tax=Pseudoalteromonas viridis TaxID=339617 RepID=A0ABX7VAC1_9GAMM|nr:serine hydrolase [Pseudoalteromonas viridis]QTL37420.1 serine hydrolase [Pseudoalteromonas viridis]
MFDLKGKKKSGWMALSLISAAVLLAGCGNSSDDHALAKHRGVWVQQGTGNLWQFDTDHLRRFQYNSHGCVQIEAHPYKELDALDQFLESDKNTLTLTTHATNDWVFTKQAEMREQCLPKNRLSGDDPEANFEYLWHMFNDYYAFFALRDIDWQAAYAAYRPQINADTSPEQLASVFEAMLEDFDDAHISLTDSKRFEVSGEGSTALYEDLAWLMQLRYADEWEAHIGKAYDEQLSEFARLTDLYLTDKKLTRYPDSNALGWGKVAGNLGYIRIDRESAMLANEETEADDFLAVISQAKQDIEDTQTLMREVMKDLADSDGIIIDLRVNDGGFDGVSLEIARFFNDQAQTVAYKQIDNSDYQQEKQALTLQAAPDQAYTKPVYVLTGELAYSAGEVLTQALKSLPHVTLIGGATNGAVSDALDFTLPNGWTGSLSHQSYSDLNNVALEAAGVMPDIELPVYARKELEWASDNVLDYAIAQLGGVPDRGHSFDAVDQGFTEELADMAIPGVAVAVIKDGQIVFEKGYGIANLETEQAMTVHAPMNVGSTSKAVMGVAIMQLIEQGRLSLDTPLSEMNLPFELAPPNNERDILLRHLVTHTSGIADTAQYNCSYYIHGTNLSLYARGGRESCEETTLTDSTEFYQAYLLPDGQYYSEDVFIGEGSLPAGSVHNYSNVGAGLAGYAVEHQLGISLVDHMQQHLFAPLGMNNTHWDHTQLPEDNPKTPQYTIDAEGVAQYVPEFSYPTFFDGDLNSSAHDLARLLIAISQGGTLDNVSVLSEQSVATMLSVQTDVPTYWMDTQGLFWFWQGPFVGHDGGDPGTHTIMSYNPYTKTGVVALANAEDGHYSDGSNIQRLQSHLAKFYRAGVAHRQ